MQFSLNPRTKKRLSALPGMIDCREAEEFLDSFLEGSLSFREKLSFRLHLSVCRECRAYLADYKATRGLVKEAESLSESATTEMPEELVRAILASRRVPRHPPDEG